MSPEDATVLGLVFILLDAIYIIHSLICLYSVVDFVWKASKKDGQGAEEQSETNATFSGSDDSSVVDIQKGKHAAVRLQLSLSRRNLQKEKEKNAQLNKNNQSNRSASRLKNQKSIRTSRVEEIQKNHAKHRDSAVRGIKQRQISRRSMLKARLAKRDKDKVKVVPVSGAAAGKGTRDEHVSGGENQGTTDDQVPIPKASIPSGEKTEQSVDEQNVEGEQATDGGITATSTMHAQEIETVRLLLKTKARSINKFKLIFGKVDQDNNGSLSKKEFKHLVQLTVKGNKEFSDSLNVYFDALWVDLCQTCQNQHNGVEVDEATATKWLFDKEGEE
jgi:hypothetical protein